MIHFIIIKGESQQPPFTSISCVKRTSKSIHSISKSLCLMILVFFVSFMFFMSFFSFLTFYQTGARLEKNGSRCSLRQQVVGEHRPEQGQGLQRLSQTHPEKVGVQRFNHFQTPIGSMYGIYIYIYIYVLTFGRY